MTRRGLEIAALGILAVATLWVGVTVSGFARDRFFTVDEYQYGHATWLVAQGQLPYRDFFEHHFPLSYVLHAPLFSDAVAGERPFDESALLLRRIVFVSWLGLAALSAGCGFLVTRDRLAAALLALAPAGLGFGLMSAVDYRADVFGAIYLGAALVLLEWNRRAARRGVAVAAGLLLAAAGLMTQKAAFVVGCALGGMLVADLVAARGGSPREPFVARPLAVLGSGAAAGLAAIAVLAALGILPRAFELTVLQALEHERHYEGFSLVGKGYLQPWWSATWPATLPTLGFAAFFLGSREGRFWIAPLLATALGLALVAAPYPYNFVLLCWLLSVAAVRGFAHAIRRLAERFPALGDAAPLLYLVPLAALPVQLRFVAGATSNTHQLAVLRKIEAHGGREATVIDSAGGAMFSPHGSYYYLHGSAHRRMFRDAFETRLLEDYRRSQALFWIRDARFAELPGNVRDWLQRHYVHGGDGLHVLGIRTPATGDASRRVELPVVRAGDYLLHPTSPGHRPEDEIRVDGRVPEGGRVRLEPGRHDVEIAPGATAYWITPVEASFFDADPQPPRYTMMFEYREPRRAEVRTALDLAHELEGAAERSGARSVDGRIEQSPGSRIRFRLPLPAAPRLRGHATLRGEARPDALLVVEIRGPHRSDTLLAQPLGEPMRHPGRRLDAGLSEYAGQEVELTLRFESEPGDQRLVWNGLRVDDVAPAGAGDEPARQSR